MATTVTVATVVIIVTILANGVTVAVEPTIPFPQARLFRQFAPSWVQTLPAFLIDNVNRWVGRVRYVPGDRNVALPGIPP